VAQEGYAGEHQALLLAHISRAVHLDARSALSQAALLDRTLDLLGVEHRDRSRGAAPTENETHGDEDDHGCPANNRAAGTVQLHAYASFSIATEAFVVGCVPPMGVASASAALDVKFLTVRTAPAATSTIVWPVFCCVPAPEP
jgi:hypothetical protein